MLGGAARATTLTRPLLSAVLQMCRTFQKSPVSRVVRPYRDSLPGTHLPESRCTVSLRATRASPAFRRSDLMAVRLRRMAHGATVVWRKSGTGRGREPSAPPPMKRA